MLKEKDLWNWLIETQIEEIKGHTEEKKIADEFADIIGICYQAIYRAGFNPEEVIYNRIHKNMGRVNDIAIKYAKMWEEKEKQEEQNDS